MSKKIISLCIFYLFIQKTKAQNLLPPIALDRPDQTESPMIVPKGYIQIESGVNFENTKKEIKTNTLPTILWKYGITPNLEFRLITERTEISQMNFGDVSNKKGVNPITVGFKVNVFEEKGLLPETSLIMHYGTKKWGNKGLQTEKSTPSFRFLMQHTLSEKFSLSYNAGAEWDGNNPNNGSAIYTLTTGYAASPKIGFYLELYGFLPGKDQSEHNVDGGMTWLINNDLMADISTGLGLNNRAPNSFIALGLSWRFKVVK